MCLLGSDQRDSCGCARPHHFPIFLFLWLSLANISVQYKLFRTRSRPMDTQRTLSYFSKEMFAVGTHWKRLFLMRIDCFTLSRLMKRPKTFWLAREEYPQLTFFCEIHRNAGSTMFKPIRCRTPTIFKCCSLTFDRITC